MEKPLRGQLTTLTVLSLPVAQTFTHHHKADTHFLSQPKHCSKCAARAQSCVSQQFLCEAQNCLRCGFDPWTSLSVVRHANHCDLSRSYVYNAILDVLFCVVFSGPATVRMVSNSGPPVPMPMQVPPGHMVQQIVDENGILTHVILSPQPPGIPAPGMMVRKFIVSCK